MVNLFEKAEKLHNIAVEISRAKAILTLLVRNHPQGDVSRDEMEAHLNICDQVQQMACDILASQFVAMDILQGELLECSGTKDEQTIAEEVRETNCTRATVEALWQFLAQPDAREILDRERELLRAEGSTLLDPRPQDGEATT